MKKLVFAALAALVVVGLGAYKLTTHEVAPESTFVLLDGSQKHTADLRGKVILVNFWATSCVVCVAEMPQLVNLHNKYKTESFDTVAVAMRYDPPAYVVNFSTSRQLPFPVAIDNTGVIAKAWGDVQATPTTYLVNRQGKIVKRYEGAPDFVELERLVEKLLKQT
jgi:peroxiredoxin